MKLSHKRFLSTLMIAGDIFMMLIAFFLMFEEDLFLVGLIMMGFLFIDVYLTIDYIRALKHREKVENSLIMDNIRAGEARRQWNQAARSRKRRRPAPQEEDLSDILQGPASPEDKAMHG